MSRPRIRTVKPECWQDEHVGALSRDARLLWIGLITLADDEGRLRAMPSLILGHCFPYDTDAPRKLEKWLAEIAARGLLVIYESDGVRYAAFSKWAKHQRVNRPVLSTLPPPPISDRAHDFAVIEGGAAA